jgi:predicted DCC family thiol-disulfide oxidoreductase YuxK
MISVNTEITENIQGYVFYDAACPLCRKWLRRVYGLLVRRGLHPVPLQAAWAKVRLGLGKSDPLVEMKLLTRDGTIYGGAEALVQIARAIWWAWPLFAIAQLPGMKSLLRKVYMRLAANRACDEGRCAMPAPAKKERHQILSAFYELP